jgi:hypothetical protein
MRTYRSLAAGFAAASILALAPVAARAETAGVEAEKLRRLDIMLMVSSLRCRFGPDNFQPEYQRFSANNLTALNDAGRVLQSDLARRHGEAAAKKALDRMSVGMANTYGQGHPWLGCGQLKTVTRDLANTHDRGVLLAAADDLLSARPAGGYALAARK